MSTQTEHIGLHQWESTDPFLREDFNEDNRKIDEALKKNEQAITATGGYVIGSYTGDGQRGRVIELGFSPTAVLVQSALRAESNNWSMQSETWLALRGQPAYYFTIGHDQGTMTLTCEENGFSPYPTGPYERDYHANMSNTLYYYIAFR